MTIHPYSPLPDRSTEDVRQSGNPDAPLPPDDLRECDLTALEEKLVHAMYADDGWIEETRDPESSRRPKTDKKLNENSGLSTSGRGGST